MTNDLYLDFNFPLFANRFANLGEDFFAPVHARPLNNSRLVAVNTQFAKKLGFTADHCLSEHFKKIFAGEELGPGSQTIAAVYSGHQFGIWAGQLGDGRAILLGDLASNEEGNTRIDRMELQLKGAGITPFSRMGDGRAVLRSSIREYLCSEAMHALKIPSTRALCLIASDQYVMREQPEKAAILTRAAPSFIRFGSFEHWYYNGQHDRLKQLADFCIRWHFPELVSASSPYYAMLKQVVEETAKLMAHWQAVGFMHGVMNTDNMSILGLTLDYGPFGFMDGYEPQKICNHSDTHERYAFHMQPQIGHWNCHALAQAILPLIDDIEAAQDALSAFVPAYEQQYHNLMASKFGLYQSRNDDEQLFDQWLGLLSASASDYSYCFRLLSNLPSTEFDQTTSRNYTELRDQILDRKAFDAWLSNYQARLQWEQSKDSERLASMRNHNPKYILRNYLAQEAIEAAEQDDYSKFHKLHQVLCSPFEEQAENERYAALPPDWATHISVSCSS
ncbi:MAG: YdiU family protein [Burkholderiaceae bacterium]|nr:MAG: YdiU family protein [Burkholderiaceae bacterium]